MAVRFQKENGIFTIDTKNTTYQMKIDSYGCLLHLYYGAAVRENMEYLLVYADRGFSGNPYEAKEDRTYSYDVLPQEYPTLGTGDYRSSALIVKNADKTECCALKYVGHEIKKGKYALCGLPAVYAGGSEAETLEIEMEDEVSGLSVKLLYGVLAEEDIITRSAVFINRGTSEMVIEKAGSACLDILSGEYDLISFYGRHAMERNFQRNPLMHGNMVLGSRRGTSSHQYNPAVILAAHNATEDTGACYGMAFVYSGSFQFEAEKDQFGQIRAVMGLQPEQFHYPLAPEERFTVPETILSFSGNGFSGLTANFHNCIRNHILRGNDPKQAGPILINSWETSYFDFNGNTILALAKEAAGLGIDLLVLDDGWFGKRDDDNSGLGDWVVNEEKLGGTLNDLSKKINELGMQFGIWVEPEMVSEDSRLYREHPDWALCVPGRKPVRSRNQLVLDFSREEVRTYVFDSICKIIEQGNIRYLKWDMNRSISDLYSKAGVPGRILYDYVRGVYDFLEKLVQKYPDLLIEGCSGGGGRFDAGMLYYTPQIWCSDNTDAIDRTRIQYGSSFFYPVSVMGSHVSAVPNHQTGRVTSLKTRGITAMAGTFGYELDVQNLTAGEKEEIREQIKTYRQYAGYIKTGSYYRLSNPFSDPYAAWLFVSEDRKKALLNVVMLEKHGNMEVIYVRLKGLLRGEIYVDGSTGRGYDSSALMEAGVPLSLQMNEYDSCQIEFTLRQAGTGGGSSCLH